MTATRYSFEMCKDEPQNTPQFVDGQRLREIAMNSGVDPKALDKLGTELLKEEQLQEALSAFRLAVALQADFAEAWSHLGAALFINNKTKEGLSACRRALELAPNLASGHRHLAMGLLLEERVAEAAVSCETALQLAPGDAESLATLGAIRMRQGRFEEASRFLDEALDIRSDLAAGYLDRARLKAHRGQIETALGDATRAVELKPYDAQAHVFQARLLSAVGNAQAAIAAARRCIAVDREQPEAYLVLAQALLQQNDPTDAEETYKRGLTLHPKHTGLWDSLGGLMLAQIRIPEALECYQHATRLAPDDTPLLLRLTECYSRFSVHAPHDAIREDLERCLAHDAVSPSKLRRVVMEYIRLNPELDCLERVAKRDDPAEFVTKLTTQRAFEALTDPLFLSILREEPLADLGIEILLQKLRREFLRQASRDGTTQGPDRQWLGLLCALAHQCFLNQYVCIETEEEKDQLQHLEENLAATLETTLATAPQRIALLAAFRPLHREPFSPALVEAIAETEPPLRTLIVRQAEEPLRESELMSSIPRATEIDDGVSQEVRAQYEKAPYPRWSRVGIARPQPVSSFITTRFPYLRQHESAWPESPRILVAGCGTGYQPIQHARLFTHAQVQALDISLASLAHALRKAQDLDLRNINFAQGDIMALGSWPQRFDIIACTGVLHHLRDPLAGWHILTDLLAEGGLMNIALYSEEARRSIVAARGFIAEGGYETTPESIRQCRADILALPEDHPVKPVSRMRDFFNLSGCRDLIFNVQEHRFTIPQIAAALSELDLTFLGFETDPIVKQHYLARFPDDPTATSLESWHQFEMENPETFLAMYQFWVRKSPV